MPDRLDIFTPTLRPEVFSGTVLADVPIAGDHREVNRLPDGNGGVKEVGVSWTYKCPFSGEERTNWQIYGPKDQVFEIMKAFAAANSPTAEARTVIFESN